MAVTNESSDVLTLQEATSGARLDRDQFGSELLFVPFEFTQGAAAGDDGSSARICKIPSGRMRYIGSLSSVAWTALGAARTLDTGWEAYVDQNGDAVAADPNGLGDGIDASSAGRAVIADSPTSAVNNYLFNSQGGVVIAITVTGGTLPAADTMQGVLVFAKG